MFFIAPRLSLLLTLQLAPATRPAIQSVPAPDQVIAIVAGNPIERDQIETGPEEYPNQHWHRFHGRVFSGLLRVYREEHAIQATEEEITDYLTAINRQIARNPEHDIAPFDLRDPKIRELGSWWVLSWKTSKALYEQYGGTVIWNQANPQEPVGAYRALFREHEARGTVTILDQAYRERIQQWLDASDGVWVIPPEQVDYSVPWWRREPATQPSG